MILPQKTFLSSFYPKVVIILIITMALLSVNYSTRRSQAREEIINPKSGINKITSITYTFENFDHEVIYHYYGCTITRYLSKTIVKEGTASNAFDYSFSRSYEIWAKFVWYYKLTKLDLTYLESFHVWVYGSGHEFCLFSYLRTGNFVGDNFGQQAAKRADFRISHTGWKEIIFNKDDFMLSEGNGFDDSKIAWIELGIGDPSDAPCSGSFYFDNMTITFSRVNDFFAETTSVVSSTTDHQETSNSTSNNLVINPSTGNETPPTISNLYLQQVTGGFDVSYLLIGSIILFFTHNKKEKRQK